MRSILTAIVVVTGFAVGCGSHSSSTPIGTVAIIDLDQVAKEVGAESQIAQRIKERETALGGQIKEAMDTFNTQIADKKTELGTQLTVDDKQIIVEMRQQAAQKITLAKQRATHDLQQFRAQQLVEFREEVRPVARAVANEKGLTIIITKTDTVYDVDESVDITSEVATRFAREQTSETTKVTAAKPVEATQR